MDITKEIAELPVIKCHGKFFIRLIQEVQVGMEVRVRLTKTVWLHVPGMGVYDNPLPGKEHASVTFTGLPFIHNEEVHFPVRSNTGLVGTVTETALQHLKLTAAPGAFSWSSKKECKSSTI